MSGQTNKVATRKKLALFLSLMIDKWQPNIQTTHKISLAPNRFKRCVSLVPKLRESEPWKSCGSVWFWPFWIPSKDFSFLPKLWGFLMEKSERSQATQPWLFQGFLLPWPTWILDTNQDWLTSITHRSNPLSLRNSWKKWQNGKTSKICELDACLWIPWDCSDIEKKIFG